jgi:hypothetical protein
MSTRLLLTLSSIAMAAAGGAGLFAPQELLRLAHLPAAAAPYVQLHGAALLGFAFTNWMAKESRMGGIYNRPLAIGNLAHFAIGALALLKAAVLVAGAVYALFALAFGVVAFGRAGNEKPRVAAGP